MSWWNDLSTHRNVAFGSHDGAPRPTTRFSPPLPDRRTASPDQQQQQQQHHGCTASTISGSFSFNPPAGTEEATWGISATQGDLSSLWQTSGSAGISDQPGTSENSPLWGPQQRPSSASPPPRGAEAFVSSPSLTGKGMLSDVVRPLTAGGSRCSYPESAAVVSNAANGVSSVHVNTASPAYTMVAGQGSHYTAVDSDRNHDETEGDAEDDDDVSLYDDVDLGTISSLIASLQGRGAKADAGSNDGPQALRSSQEDRLHGDTQLPPTAAATAASSPAIVIDAGGTATGQSRLIPHARFADPMWTAPTDGEQRRSGNSSVAGFSRSHTRTCSSVAMMEGGEGATAATGDAAAAAAIAPLHLTPSMLEGILANFQTALRGRAGEATAKSPMPQLADAEGSHSEAPEMALGTADGAPLLSRGSPLMRSHVSPVVAHKLNIDVNPRGTPVQDFRRGMAASTTSSCSDPSTPVRQRGTSASERHAALQHPPHERAASPDSSIDCFFSHTTPTPTNFAAVRHFVSNSTMDDSAVAHLHRRTESDVSLPAAASTYNGSSALHHNVDERGCITVVDPQRRKLHVPLSAIQTTKALNGRLKTPSLCLLFQSGRCRQGDNCYQVHVDPATVDRLRIDVENMPCCCLLHGDCNCHLVDPACYEGRSLLIAGQYNVPLSRVAYTAGLQRVLQEEAMSVPVNPSVLCRLHGQRGGCRFGADCKFVHVCCSILRSDLAGVMSNAASAAAAASTHTEPTQMEVHMQQQQQHPLPRLVSSAPGSPSTYVHSHSSSATGTVGSVVNLPLPTTMHPSALAPRQMLAVPASAAATGELTLSPPLSMQAAGRPMHGPASPSSAELRLNGGGMQMAGGGANAPAAAAALYNRTFDPVPHQNGGFHPHNRSSSLVTSATFAPMQLSQGMQPVLSAAHGNAAAAAALGFSNNGGLPLQSQPSGTLFTVTTVQQPRTSPVQATSTSVPNSPQPGYHLRTLSTPSSGPQSLYPTATLVATPNRSGAGSPANTGLPAARSMPNLCGSPSAFAARGGGGRSSDFSSPVQRQLPRQLTPQQQPPQHPHHQHSNSQQFYVQQVNQDGSVTFVPVNMMHNIGQ